MYNRKNIVRTLALASAAVAAPGVHADQPATPSPVVTAASSIGITPESLVASGIAGAQCSTAGDVLYRLDQAQELRTALLQARTTVDEAAGTLRAIAVQLSTEANDQSLQAQYTQAVSDLDSAHQQLTSAEQALRDVALDGVDTQKISMLQIWRSNAARVVPEEFRVVDLTEEQWRPIEVALRAEKRANRLGEQLATEHAQVLAAIRADFDVIEAQLRLDTDLAAVTTAFEQYGSE